MCAAPGSKTTQLIEMLHADMSVPFPGMHLVGVWRAGAPSARVLGARKLLDSCLSLSGGAGQFAHCHPESPASMHHAARGLSFEFECFLEQQMVCLY